MDTITWIGIIFAVLGACFLVGGIRSWLAGRAFHRLALRTNGTVTELRPVRGYSQPGENTTGTTYAPVLAFRTHGGEDVEAVSWMSQSPPTERVGQAVAVLYDPNDPSSAIVDKPGAGGGFVSVAVAAFGVLGLAVGLVLLCGGF